MFEALRNSCAVPGERFAHSLRVGSSARASHDPPPPQQDDHRDADQDGNDRSRLRGFTCGTALGRQDS
jgi:hypothetical protein